MPMIFKALHNQLNVYN